MSSPTVPSMGAEDFAFVIEQKPGAYVGIGNGPDVGGCNLHCPHYDFNDTVLPHGVRYGSNLPSRRPLRFNCGVSVVCLGI